MNSLRVILRSCNKLHNLQSKNSLNIVSFSIKFKRYSTSTVNELIRLNDDDDYYKSIKYSEVLLSLKQSKPKSESDEPLFLKYVGAEEGVKNVGSESIGEGGDSEALSFPYKINKQFLVVPRSEEVLTESFPKEILNLTPSDNEKIGMPEWKPEEFETGKKDWIDPRKWVMEDDDDDIENIQEVFDFGSCDPTCPISKVPCGGCGALLHCTDMSIPGFIPKEIFIKRSEKQLRSEICQRCNFLKEFDVALGVNVSPDEYPKIISTIRDKPALVVLLIDLTDFPCSIWPGIMDIIGSLKHILVVGNKVDLFIQEGSWFPSHLKKCLEISLKEQGIDMENIKDIHLISAKTGYGVEELINKLLKNWGVKGDVYIVGCTNVGKSTLFNSLIQSDYCKIKASEIMHRATISAWPGTTLNLLKFPIKKPIGWKYALRVHRLMHQRKEKAAFQKVQKMKHNIRLEQIPLEGYVSQTVVKKAEFDNSDDLFTNEGNPHTLGLNPDIHDFQGKWCYDTPGVVHQDHIIHLLTTSELLLTLPKNMLIPRNFHLKPGSSLFVGGLARFDYVKGVQHVWVTVYASKELPVTVTGIEDAEVSYKKFLGTPIFRVPFGGKDRLDKWPMLQSKKFEVIGKVPGEADADIVLSSAGWVSVKIPPAYRCLFEAWTPEGRGIHLRNKPVIKFGHTFRGNRIGNTPAYKVVMKEVQGSSIKEKPRFSSSTSSSSSSNTPP